jgi:hypothetical protein
MSAHSSRHVGHGCSSGGSEEPENGQSYATAVATPPKSALSLSHPSRAWRAQALRSWGHVACCISDGLRALPACCARVTHYGYAAACQARPRCPHAAHCARPHAVRIASLTPAAHCPRSCADVLCCAAFPCTPRRASCARIPLRLLRRDTLRAARSAAHSRPNRARARRHRRPLRRRQVRAHRAQDGRDSSPRSGCQRASCTRATPCTATSARCAARVETSSSSSASPARRPSLPGYSRTYPRPCASSRSPRTRKCAAARLSGMGIH